MHAPSHRLRLAALLPLVLLAGCANFFVKPTTTGTGTGGATSSNIVFLANATANTIAAYQVGADALTAVAGSPFALTFTPQSVVVSRANTFLYVATATAPGTTPNAGASPAIYGYSIASDGALTSLGALAPYNLLSMDVSPDGQWLVGLDGLTQVLDVFSINLSSGALTLAGTGQAPYTTTSTAVTPRVVRFAPSGNFLFAALGSAGDVVFSFDTVHGDAAQIQALTLPATTVSDNALLVNSTGTTLYIARSGTSSGVAVYTIGPAGALTPATGSPFAAGNTPTSLAIDPTNTYIYAANRADGTLSGFLIGATTPLTLLGSSPYPTGTLPIALSLDKGGAYLLAAANGALPDLTMYAFDATTAGKLDTVASVTSAANAGAIAIATTH